MTEYGSPSAESRKAKVFLNDFNAFWIFCEKFVNKRLKVGNKNCQTNKYLSYSRGNSKVARWHLDSGFQRNNNSFKLETILTKLELALTNLR